MRWCTGSQCNDFMNSTEQEKQGERLRNNFGHVDVLLYPCLRYCKGGNFRVGVIPSHCPSVTIVNIRVTATPLEVIISALGLGHVSLRSFLGVVGTHSHPCTDQGGPRSTASADVFRRL